MATTISIENRGKFNAKGQPGFFPGITTLCHLPSTGTSETLHEVIQKHFIDAAPSILRENYVLLPKASWHMTILDVATYTAAGENRAADLDASEGRDAVFARIAADVARYKLAFHEAKEEIKQYLPIRMGFDFGAERAMGNGRPVDVPVAPLDGVEAGKIARVRKILAGVCGMKEPDLEGEGMEKYVFHVSLGYPLKVLTEEELGELQTAWKKSLKALSDEVGSFDIGMVELCTFENMCHFQAEDSVNV